MKHLRGLLYSLLILAATRSLNSQELKTIIGPGEATGNAPAAPVPMNPLKVALLHWYKADLATTFAVGNQPYGLAFDGANIWCANFFDNTVTKLRASDGAVLGAFPVGTEPIGVTFDGANLWVPNVYNMVTKLRASDGKSLGIFTVGIAPTAAAFDGANIWVTNDGDNTVTKLRATDGSVLGTFAVGILPIGVAFDGTNIWVANRVGTLSKLRPSDGSTLGTFTVPGSPYGVAFDGTNIWTTMDASIVELRPSDGTILQQIFHRQTTGVAFDGAFIWVASTDTNQVYKF